MLYDPLAIETEENFQLKKFIIPSGAESNICQDASVFGAFECGILLMLCLYINRRAGACSPELYLYSDKYNNEHGKEYRKEFLWKKYSDGFDLYTLILPLDEVGLYFYSIEYNSPNGKKFVTNPLALNDFEKYNFQLLVHKKLSAFPNHLRGGIIYQIFCDRFYRSESSPSLSDLPIEKKYAEINHDKTNGIPKYAKNAGDPLDCNDFFGGDLYGVRDKLEYLASLGVNIIYLNPIFEAHTNHKYDTGDYMTVDPMFGGNEALKALIESAKKYNIGIVLDGVFNHSGDDSLYFNRFGNYNSVGAYNSKESPYYRWYTFYDYPENYRCWWGIKLHPELNKSDPSFCEFILGQNGVIRHYLKMGAAGWRLDVTDELPDDFIKGIKQAAKAEAPDSIIIGEVWEDASNKISLGNRRKYLYGEELDSVMNYPIRGAVIDYLLYRNSENLYKVSASLYSHYPKAVSDVTMNILGTHDTERIISILSGKDVSSASADQLAHDRLTPDEKSLAIKRLKLGYLLISTLPGIPSIYYGDEAGLEGWRDPFNRRFFPWGNEIQELIDWYRKIGKIRRNEPLFSNGIYHVLYHKNGVFAFCRSSENEEFNELQEKSNNRLNKNKFCNIIIVLNNSGGDFTLKLNCRYSDLLCDTEYSDSITIPNTDAVILKLLS